MSVVLCWFSAGITSTVACKLAIEEYGVENVKVFFFETNSHHPDNTRFIAECETWFGTKIIVRSNTKYTDVFDVLETEKYINGPSGARCTFELKRKLRLAIQKELGTWQRQVFGFEFSKKEINRALRFAEQYPQTKPRFPLIEQRLTKPACFQIIQDAGLEIPAMYRLGYHNNNCIGCVKGGKGYWNKIRIDFPDVFDRMAKTERVVGASCINGTFLDELPRDAGTHEPPITGECGVVCAVDFGTITDPRLAAVLQGGSIESALKLDPKPGDRFIYKDGKVLRQRKVL